MTLQVESSIKAPGISRSQLEAMKAKLGSRYDDVVLVVSELVSNSVRHAASGGIDVKISAGAGRIRIEVRDEGSGFSLDDPRGEGSGLAIVDRLAERWGLRDGLHEFTVWAELSSRLPER